MTTAMLHRENHIRSLALALARNRVGPDDPLAEVLARECVAPEEFDELAEDVLFKRYLNEYVKELTETGVSFQMKARVLAEDLLPVMYSLAIDPDAPASARVKMMENMVDWAGVAPKQAVNPAQVGAGFHITFNIPDVSGLPSTQKASITVEQAPPLLQAVFDGEHSVVSEDEGVYVE